jgi:hypothetical protein
MNVAIMKFKNNKAVAVDQIPTEILKDEPSVTANILESEKYPENGKKELLLNCRKNATLNTAITGVVL